MWHTKRELHGIQKEKKGKKLSLVVNLNVKKVLEMADPANTGNAHLYVVFKFTWLRECRNVLHSQSLVHSDMLLGWVF